MKLLALSLIGAFPALFGFYWGESHRKRAKTRSELIRFFHHTKFRIEAFLQGQEMIYESFHSPHLEKEGFLLQVRWEVKKEPCGAMYRAMLDFLENEKLSEEEKTALISFCRDFGYRSRESELKECTKLISLLESEEKKEAPLLQGRIRLARTLGATAGLGMIILLL